MKKFKFALSVVFAAVIIVTMLTVNAVAEISVQDGAVVGLDPNTYYKKAQVTLANYTAPSYESLPKGISRIDGLEPGLWYIYNNSTGSVTAVWIKGDTSTINDIGEISYSSIAQKDAVKASDTDSWLEGTWTGIGCSNDFKNTSAYYLSSYNDRHITKIDLEGFKSGTISTENMKDKVEGIYFKYAYASDEIIPVDELYSIGFNVGIRQGSLQISYSNNAEDPNVKAKYVLYTMGTDGKVTSHSALIPTTYDVVTKAKNSHSVFVKQAFPEATGWVVGIEVYPYGDVPLSGLSFSLIDDAITSTIFCLEYVPEEYITKYKSVKIPAQYNGANTAYVDGYADGSFRPDSNITKAEAAALLAKIHYGNSSYPAFSGTSFVDCSVNDWFYSAVCYIEYYEGFEYTDSARFYPDTHITRWELAQMLYSLTSAHEAMTCSFTDVNVDDPFFTAVCSLASAGVINGYSDGSFRPYDNVSRAEAITMMNRALNLKADKSTVVKSTLKKSFNDIEGHWAEYQILMAANDNVKTPSHLDASAAALLETDNIIQIETEHIKVTLNRHNGKVTSMINKDDETEILAASVTPWFTYIINDDGFSFYPTELNIVDNRLETVYSNGLKAYFIFDLTDNYFTVELDSELPIGISRLVFANMRVNTAYSEDDENSYRFSGVTMNANTNSSYFPGGASKAVDAIVMRRFGTIGAKIGVLFSKFGGTKEGEHRAYLKDILDDIDTSVGISSTKGGAYSYDNADVFGDYVILSSNFTADTASETAQLMKDCSIDQLDIHQGDYTFTQGEFNFKCAAVAGESFTTAAQFRERVGQAALNQGVQLGLHTYSSLIPSNATTILTNPKWQKQIMHIDSENLTLASNVTADDTVFLTNEDPTGIKLTGETAKGASSSLPWSGPNTGYFLIDEEIVLVTSHNTTGLTTVSRGQCGTKATAHSAGATIIHYLGHYGMFQSIPGSELFYHIADLTAQAYNDGGFEMIYLDAFESIAREPFSTSEDRWYYYASFLQRLISQCEKDPIIEGSEFTVAFWNARARGGATDHATRETKKFNYNHMIDNKTFLSKYLTATLGWFNYAPDITEAYKNTYHKTIFRDDLDFMGSIGVAFDMSTAANNFSVTTYNNYPTISNNTKYYSLYSRLRKSGYFSDSVKQTLQSGILNGKEYKLEEQSDGSWAFREMTYFKNKVFDLSDTTYSTGSGTNPYNAQTPYIRIEQRFSTKSSNEKLVIAFDETAEVSTLTGKHSFEQTDLSNYRAFKIKVYGNGDKNDGILLTLGSTGGSETGRLDFFLPTSHTGWREFILIDADNADYDGYDFEGDDITSRNLRTFRNEYNFTTANSVTVNIAGDCAGVMIDDLKGYTITNSPVKNPSVTINGSTITFSTTVRSGEYIEYLPELGKAYHHSYNKTSGKADNGNTATVTEISFSGSVTVPEGDFTYTYNATSGLTTIENFMNYAYLGGPIRAKVVIGVKSSGLIKNEDSWTAPEVDIPEDIQWVTLG